MKEELNWNSVTHQENHESCGTKVVWKEQYSSNFALQQDIERELLSTYPGEVGKSLDCGKRIMDLINATQSPSH